MRSSALTRGTIALTAAAVSATLLTAGAGAAAAATPPYEPDPNAVGTITFYDHTGNIITSGSTQVPFAGYAVGSAAPRSSDQQAGLVFANPNPNSQPYAWYKSQTGTFTSYPVTSGPSSINSQTTPVYSVGSSDETIDSFESTATQYSGTGYTNMVQVRLYTANAAGSVASTYDDADLLIDPATHTWTEVYPTNAGGGATPPVTNDGTSLSVDAPGAVNFGGTARITGSLTDTTTNTGIGSASVSLYERSSNGAARHLVRTVSSGSGGQLATTVKLTAGEQFQWVYAGATGHDAASSGFRAVGVNTAASISNGGTIRRGQTATLFGSTTPATGGTRVFLQVLIGKRWKNVASAVERRQKLPNRKRAVGYVFRFKITKKGTFKFRVSKPATPSLRGSVSRTIIEHVK